MLLLFQRHASSADERLDFLLKKKGGPRKRGVSSRLFTPSLWAGKAGTTPYSPKRENRESPRFFLEVAPLYEGEMGADRPVVFRGRRRDLDPRNAAGMDARAGIVIDGIGLVLPADAPRADARLQEAALREG